VISRPLKVSEVNRYIKRMFLGDLILSNIQVEGEISNFKCHHSGHVYFSLKDDQGKINCVLFKNYRNNVDDRMEIR
jgi:exodeoxyribonuclease VII large subunit